MNQKELIMKRKETESHFHCPGMPQYAKRKRNAVFISVANSIEHEKAKLEICYNIHKEGHDFITECVNNKSGLRHDVLDLDAGVIYEVECEKSRSLRFDDIKKSYPFEIIVIPLWKDKTSQKI